jgi:hypothetical protein
MTHFYKKNLFTGFFSFFLCLNAFSQVVINEICPSNISLIKNSNGSYDDWIELHNAGGSTVNISGYGLSDDPTKPFRFTFPNYSLAAGKKVMVFASDSTSEIVVDHWEMPIDALSSWRYVSGSSSIDTNWRNPSFNQSSWLTGNGGIGFGDSDDNTTIPVGVSVMMRKTFNIPDTSQILKAVLMMDYDDSFVAYLNGVEIARANIGTAGVRPAWNALALSSHEAVRYQGQQPDSFFISPNVFKPLLRPTNNVFAVEVHNSTTTGSDLSSIPFLFFGMRSAGSTFAAKPSWFLVPSKEYFNANFKLSRTGETVYLVNSSGTVIDQKSYASMDADNSIGRKPDGSSSWCFFSTPTPDASNASTCYSGYAFTPVFSKQGGYYTSTQSIVLTNNTPGGVIRYTTNGDVPTTSSKQYTSAISVSSSKTIRARVFASGYLPSPVITNTYVINGSTKLSMIAITTDSLNLWDYNTGIYVKGPNAEATSPYKGANFWQDWSKPASIEYFDKNKNLVVKFDADIEIYGNYSRSKDQKSFEIKLSDKYGTGSFDYSMIPDKPYINENDNIILRNAGTDWNKVHFRDAMMERIMKNTYSGYLATEPAIAYLNGAYWGVYHLYENHDQHWMKNNFGLKKDEIDYLIEGGSSIDVKYGSDATFWDLYNYATVQSPTSSGYYNYVSNLLDIQNYTDYFIAETFYNNGDWIGDWTNNIKMWRPNAPGSKWRYMLYDLDYCMGYAGSVNDNKIAIARNPASFSFSSELFDAILKNPTYKKYFINRYADLINTIFLPANVDAIMKSYRDTMSFDMTAHFSKWGSSVSTWNSNINSMMSWANSRPSIVQDQIKSEFGLSKKVILTLAVSPAGAGRIEISTITPASYPWSGVYFNGNPVTITAIPNPGYTFTHFRSTKTITSNNLNQSVTYNYTQDDQITAYFTGSSVTPKICVSELNYNSDSAFNAGDWLELHNYGSTSIDLSGWKLMDGNENHKYVFPTGTKIAANGYLVLVEDSIKFKVQFPNVNNRIGLIGFNFSNGGDEIRLFNHQNNLYLNFFYQDVSPWPIGADGEGYTLELSSNTANPNNANSWFAGCIGGSPGRAYNPLLAIPVSISGNTTFCAGGSATLNATYVPGYSYQWKRNNVDIPGANDSILTATQTGDYTVSVSYQGCSSVTTPTTITVVSQQPEPSVVPGSRCGDGKVVLHASASDSVFWYDSNTGGNLLGIGDSLVTPTINQTTTYYARTGRNCQSNSVNVQATIIPLAAAPVASNASRCGPGIVTLTATDTAAIRWYNAPTGGGLIETGSTFVTNVISNDTSFYVEAGSVCTSPRIEVSVTVITAIEPDVLDDSRCGPGTLTLTASSPFNVVWYNSMTGGTQVGTGLTYTTNSISVTDTFYAEANNGCPSARVMGIAIVTPIPPVPTVNDTFICSPGSATIIAAATEQVNWFDAPSGGNLLFSGLNFVTPSLSSTTTYYAANGYTCLSARIPVQVVLSSPPSPPSASSVSRCGPGSVTLNATSPELIYWYDAPTAGTLLATSDFYNTPSLSATKTYYAEAGTFCRSANRTAVQAIVNSVSNPPVTQNVSRCGAGTVTLSATATDPISWYSSSSGGSSIGNGPSFITPSLSSTTTYYVESGTTCTSNRVAVQAIISQPPSVPTISNVSRCGSGTVTLTAVSSSAVNWFTASSGGSPAGTGLSFVTPSLSSTTTYYAEADNGCSSSRVSAQAIINAIPSPPTTSSVSRCGNGSVTITATSAEQIYWYTSSSGGSPVATGSTFTTPSLSSTTTYYVETGDNCRSTRVSVQAILLQPPSAPTLSSASNCGPGTVTLTASSSAQVNWFSNSSGGTSIGTGLSFTTPVLSTTTTYYADASASGCTSSRNSVQAVVNSIPASPATTDNSRCGPGTVTVSATSPHSVKWYNVPSGGSSLGTGLSFTTPSISATTTYYAEASNSNCNSSRSPVQAIVQTVPAAPQASDVTRCGNGSVILTAISSEQIYWYTASSGGSPVATGSTFTTPSLSSTKTYYVETGDNCRSTRTSVQAIVVQSLSAPSLTSGSNCGPGTVTLTASSSAQVNWFNSSSGGSPIGTGLSFTTPVLSSTTTYYAEATGIGSGCTSARSSVQAVIISPPAAPSTIDNSRCGPGTVTVNAVSPHSVKWFSVPSGGTSLGTGLSFTTPAINATTTYYAEASNSNCNSLRSPVQAIVQAPPAAPQASNVSRCSTGALTITAVSPEQIYWYTSSSGGSPVFTGSSYTTPSISTTTTYYVETGDQCRSSRIPVQAIIIQTPSAPTLTGGSNCGSGSVTVTAASPWPVHWYAQSSGGTLLGTGLTFNSPVLSSTTTYYAEAINTGCPSIRSSVQAVISSIPSPPALTGNSRCGAGSLLLTAISSGTVRWYNSFSGGSVLHTGLAFNTPSIGSTTTYYAETYDGCTSSRVSVQAVVNSLPAAPTVSDGNNCGPGTITLTATSTEQLNWYSVLSGGTSLATGSTFVTPFITSSTTYYVEAGTTCRSQRVPVQATIYQTAQTPVLNDGNRCGPGSVTLTAVSAAPVFWYTVPSGGVSVGTGLSYSTPSVSSTTTFYAEAGTAGCNSARVAVQAIVNTVPAPPTASGSSRCGPGTLVLTASAPVGQLYWFSNSGSQSILGTGVTFTTPSINSSKNYYVEVNDGACTSSRVQVNASVIQLPPPPQTNDVSRCGPGQVTLAASSSNPVYWYDAATGGNLLTTGTTFTTPSLTTSTSYYVETGTTCMSNRIQVKALIVTNPPPPAVFDTLRCGDGTVIIRASSSSRVNWFSAPSGGTVLDTGLYFSTPHLFASTTYYAEAGLGCNSFRVPVQAEVVYPSAPPTAADSSRCGPGAISLKAFSPEAIYWYDTPTGGNLLHSGSVFVTPVIHTTTTYYAEAGDFCRSVRFPVQAIISGTQVASVSGGTICGSGVAILTANTTLHNDSIVWYDVPGGNVLGTGIYFVTPYLTAPATYYVAANSACTGSPVVASVTIAAVPFVDIGVDTLFIVGGQSIPLDAGPGFSSYIWSTNESSQTIHISAPGVYSVTVADSNGCSATDQVIILLSTSVNSITKADPFIVYPNPAHEKITIAVPSVFSRSCSIKLISADGKVVLSEEINGQGLRYTKELSLTGIAAGVYFLRIENTDDSEMVRVVVQ